MRVARQRGSPRFLTPLQRGCRALTRETREAVPTPVFGSCLAAKRKGVCTVCALRMRCSLNGTVGARPRVCALAKSTHAPAGKCPLATMNTPSDRSGAEMGADRLDAAMRLVALRARLLCVQFRRRRSGARAASATDEEVPDLLALCKSPQLEAIQYPDDGHLAGIVAARGRTTSHTALYGPTLHAALTRPPPPRRFPAAPDDSTPSADEARAPMVVIQSVIQPARSESPFSLVRHRAC